jgi:hypothetical protein
MTNNKETIAGTIYCCPVYGNKSNSLHALGF